MLAQLLVYLAGLEVSSIFLVPKPTSVGAGAGACRCQEGKEGRKLFQLLVHSPSNRKAAFPWSVVVL